MAKVTRNELIEQIKALDPSVPVSKLSLGSLKEMLEGMKKAAEKEGAAAEAAAKEAAAETYVKPDCFGQLYEADDTACNGCDLARNCQNLMVESAAAAAAAEELEAELNPVVEVASLTEAAEAELPVIDASESEIAASVLSTPDKPPRTVKSLTTATFNTNEAGKLIFSPEGAGAIVFKAGDRIKVTKGKYTGRLGTVQKYFPPRDVLWLMLDGVSIIPDVRPNNVELV